MTLSLAPVTVKDASAWVRSTHRRLPSLQGAMWAVQVRRDGARVGVALVGVPRARRAMGPAGARVEHLEVLRVAVVERDASGSGQRGACSMLYGACARAARAMGAASIRTYTHLDEPGTSLRAAGWVEAYETDGGQWDRATRQRALAIDAKPKRVWFAPWCPPAARHPVGWRETDDLLPEAASA